MQHNKCGFCLSRAHSPGFRCASSLAPWASPPRLTSLTDSKVATVGLTSFFIPDLLMQPGAQEDEGGGGKKKEKKKLPSIEQLCHLFWRVISSSGVHLMVKSCDAVVRRKKPPVVEYLKENNLPIETVLFSQKHWFMFSGSAGCFFLWYVQGV